MNEQEKQERNKQIDQQVTEQLVQQVGSALIGEVMAYYDLSTEEWESIPLPIQAKLFNVYHSN
jgi:hypothetical protein